MGIQASTITVVISEESEVSKTVADDIQAIISRELPNPPSNLIIFITGHGLKKLYAKGISKIHKPGTLSYPYVFQNVKDRYLGVPPRILCVRETKWIEASPQAKRDSLVSCLLNN